MGGRCAYWACIPSKTLLRPPEVGFEARRTAGTVEPEQRWREVAEYRDFMVRNLDDGKQVEGYEQSGVRVYKAHAHVTGPGRVEVDGERLDTDRLILATGSDAKVPPVAGLEEAGYWTNREATTLREVPSSVVALGGGPIGIELGQFMRRFGAAVTVVEMSDRLLPREDPAVGELIAQALRTEGIDVRLGVGVNEVAAANGQRVVRLDDCDEVCGDELPVAVGRAPRVDVGDRRRGADLAAGP